MNAPYTFYRHGTPPTYYTADYAGQPGITYYDSSIDRNTTETYNGMATSCPICCGYGGGAPTNHCTSAYYADDLGNAPDGQNYIERLCCEDSGIITYDLVVPVCTMPIDENA